MSELRNEASYCLGLSIGLSLKSQNLDQISLDEFLLGLKEVFEDGVPRFTAEEANERISMYLNGQNEKRFAGNKEQSEAFLAENAKRNEVFTLPSGLQYEVITEGSGEKPSVTSKVSVHYHGTLADGTIFDSSVERGEPAAFGVNQVIAGWTEALQLMPVGSKWKLFIPQGLAYGANPRPGGPIEPYMALVFEVELLSVD